MYVAAYAPEAGETLEAINARYPDVPAVSRVAHLHLSLITAGDLAATV